MSTLSLWVLLLSEKFPVSRLSLVSTLMSKWAEKDLKWWSLLRPFIMIYCSWFYYLYLCYTRFCLSSLGLELSNSFWECLSLWTLGFYLFVVGPFPSPLSSLLSDFSTLPFRTRFTLFSFQDLRSVVSSESTLNIVVLRVLLVIFFIFPSRVFPGTFSVR